MFPMFITLLLVYTFQKASCSDCSHCRDGSHCDAVGYYGKCTVGAPFERWYNGKDHFYATDINKEFASGTHGYWWEWRQCQLPFDGDKTLYRWYNIISGDHYYTTDNPEQNLGSCVPSSTDWTCEGVIGKCFSSDSKAADLLPLYQYDLSNGDHFYTTTLDELGGSPKIQCYVYPPYKYTGDSPNYNQNYLKTKVNGIEYCLTDGRKWDSDCERADWDNNNKCVWDRKGHALNDGEHNLYWSKGGNRCESFTFNEGRFSYVSDGITFYIKWHQDTNSGYEIGKNERNMKAVSSSGDRFYVAYGSICSTAAHSECCMEWDSDEHHYYGPNDQNQFLEGDYPNDDGQEAKFDCDGGQNTVYWANSAYNGGININAAETEYSHDIHRNFFLSMNGYHYPLRLIFGGLILLIGLISCYSIVMVWKNAKIQNYKL